MPVRTKKNDPIMVACEHKVSSNIGAILSKCNTYHVTLMYILHISEKWNKPKELKNEMKRKD